MAYEVNIPAPFDTWYTLKQAAKAMEFKHAQYVRNLLKKGRLGTYVEVRTDADGQPVVDEDGAFIVESGSRIKLLVGKVEQWRIDPRACEAYKAEAAASGGAFGQHAVRRMSLRFSTAHFTIEEITAILKEGMGEPEVDGEFRYEFSKAWKGGSKKKKAAKPGAPVMATIISSLTGPASIDDEDDFEDDLDEDDLDDVLS